MGPIWGTIWGLDLRVPEEVTNPLCAHSPYDTHDLRSTHHSYHDQRSPGMASFRGPFGGTNMRSRNPEITDLGVCETPFWTVHYPEYPSTGNPGFGVYLGPHIGGLLEVSNTLLIL